MQPYSALFARIPLMRAHVKPADESLVDEAKRLVDRGEGSDVDSAGINLLRTGHL